MSIFPEDFFEYCTWDNPVFMHGMFWLAVCLVTGFYTIHYKLEDARESKQEQDLLNSLLKKQQSSTVKSTSLSAQQKVAANKQVKEADQVKQDKMLNERLAKKEELRLASIKQSAIAENETDELNDSPKKGAPKQSKNKAKA